MDRTTPTFNLKAVVQETGVKPDTLRAWERRYGLPEPNRSAGGHRLYSQRDIDTLRWLLARQEEGLSISRAVKLWHQVEREEGDPLQSLQYGLNDSNRAAPVLSGGEISSAREKWMDACLNFNERSAEQILAQAFALFPVEVVCLEVLQRGIGEIGEGWYEGRVSVQQEHFASALAVRKLESILASTSPPQRAGRILLAGAAEENHIIGQLVFQLLLRRKGWETVDWGANVPLLRLEESLDAVRPQLVVLTAQQLYTAARLQTMANNLAHTGIPVAYAGRSFVYMPELCSRIRGHYLGDALQQAVEKVETLIPLAPPLAEVSPVSPAYLRALARFQSKATTIQAHIMGIMDQFEAQPNHIEIAGLNLTRSIFAALQLGDIDLMRGEIDWIRGLLHNFEIAESHLVRFFNSYREAAHRVLGADGQPVLEWLDKTCDELQRAP